MSKKSKDQGLDVPVEFAGVSIGDATARVGISIDRDDINWPLVERYFCNSRLQIRITLDDGEQQHLEGMEPEPLDSVVDVKGYRATAKNFSAGLTFALEEVDVEQLSYFAKKKGRLSGKRIGEASDAPSEHDEDGEDPAALFERDGDKDEAAAGAAARQHSDGELDSAVQAVLLHGDGAATRWAALRRSGASDETLIDAIRQELGDRGSFDANGVTYSWQGGRYPGVWIGAADGKAHVGGPQLLERARRALEISTEPAPDDFDQDEATGPKRRGRRSAEPAPA